MSKFTLRKAFPDDIELSFAIRKNAMYKYIADSKGWFEDKEMQDHIEDFSTDTMKIIEVDGKPVGVFESVVEDGYIHIHGFYLLEEFQNCKIGSRVMKEIICKADDEKKSILLQVLKVNHRAKAFYERIGFKVYNETEQHFQMIFNTSDL